MINKKAIYAAIIALNITFVSALHAEDKGIMTNHLKYAKEAEQLIKEKRYEEAIKKCKKAIATNEEPDDYNTYIMMADAYKKISKYKLALESLDGAKKILVTRHPDFKYRKNELCSLSLKKGFLNMDLSNYEEAARDFKLSLQECAHYGDADKSASYSWLAFAENQAGKNVDALRSIGEAIKLAPVNAEYYSRKAIILSALGFKEDALKACDKAINLSPEDVIYYQVKKAISEKK